VTGAPATLRRPGTGGEGELDLFVALGDRPTAAHNKPSAREFACTDAAEGNTGSCTVETGEATEAWVLVNSWNSDAASYGLAVSWTE
jgi:hypothetical protein